MEQQRSGIDMESIRVQGEQLMDRLRELIEEGNVRRIVVKQGTRTVAEFPLTLGVVGVVLAPVLAAIGALAALLSDCSIEVERDPNAPPRGGSGTSGPGQPS